jgi:hypothetical protein
MFKILAKITLLLLLQNCGNQERADTQAHESRGLTKLRKELGLTKKQVQQIAGQLNKSTVFAQQCGIEREQALAERDIILAENKHDSHKIIDLQQKYNNLLEQKNHELKNSANKISYLQNTHDINSKNLITKEQEITNLKQENATNLADFQKNKKIDQKEIKKLTKNIAKEEQKYEQLQQEAEANLEILRQYLAQQQDQAAQAIKLAHDEIYELKKALLEEAKEASNARARATNLEEIALELKESKRQQQEMQQEFEILQTKLREEKTVVQAKILKLKTAQQEKLEATQKVNILENSLAEQENLIHAKDLELKTSQQEKLEATQKVNILESSLRQQESLTQAKALELKTSQQEKLEAIQKINILESSLRQQESLIHAKDLELKTSQQEILQATQKVNILESSLQEQESLTHAKDLELKTSQQEKLQATQKVNILESSLREQESLTHAKDLELKTSQQEKLQATQKVNILESSLREQESLTHAKALELKTSEQEKLKATQKISELENDLRVQKNLGQEKLDELEKFLHEQKAWAQEKRAFLDQSRHAENAWKIKEKELENDIEQLRSNLHRTYLELKECKKRIPNPDLLKSGIINGDKEAFFRSVIGNIEQTHDEEMLADEKSAELETSFNLSTSWVVSPNFATEETSSLITYRKEGDDYILGLHPSLSANNYNALLDFNDLSYAAAKKLTALEPKKRELLELRKSLLKKELYEHKKWSKIRKIAGKTGYENNSDDITCIITDNKEENLIYVIFHGSCSGRMIEGLFYNNGVGDWGANHDYETVAGGDGLRHVEQNVLIHRGFARNLASAQDAIFTELHETLKDYDEKNPPRIIVTGHSKGGAMASIAAPMIKLEVKTRAHVSAIIFSAPRAYKGVHSREWAESVMGKLDFLHIFVYGDLATQVPPSFFDFYHVGMIALDYYDDVKQRLIALDLELPGLLELKRWAGLYHFGNRRDESLMYDPRTVTPHDQLLNNIERGRAHLGQAGKLTQSALVLETKSSK